MRVPHVADDQAKRRVLAPAKFLGKQIGHVPEFLGGFPHALLQLRRDWIWRVAKHPGGGTDRYPRLAGNVVKCCLLVVAPFAQRWNSRRIEPVVWSKQG